MLSQLFLTLFSGRLVLKVRKTSLSSLRDLNISRENESGSVFWCSDITKSVQSFLHMCNSVVNA